MKVPFFDPNWIATTQAFIPVLIAYARAMLGWSSIALGVFGSIMPIIPGLPFLLIGVHLLGHRNPRLRWTRVNSKLFLRRCTRSSAPWVYKPARMVRTNYAQARRVLYDRRRACKPKPQT